MDDYSQFDMDATPAQSEIQQLAALVEQLDTALLLEAQAEEALAAANARVVSLQETLIPAAMQQCQMTEYVHAPTGRRVVLERKINATISKENRERAQRWLDANGHGGLLRRMIGVEFTRAEEVQAKELLTRLAAEFPHAFQEAIVPAPTIKSFVTKELEAGRDVPRDIFSVTDRKVAGTKTNSKRKGKKHFDDE